jgi:hypothetical protein
VHDHKLAHCGTSLNPGSDYKHNKFQLYYTCDGKVVEDDWVDDAMGMMRQLGIVPSVVAKAA